MTPPTHSDRVGRLDLDTLRRAYVDGTLRPVDVVEAVLARIDGRGEDAVWISRVAGADLRAAAAALDLTDLERLPLFGVPFAVKDNIDVTGLDTTAACPDFAYRPASSAALVQRLVDAGALVVGKTNLDQFASGLNGTRSPYGVPASVLDQSLISGGSSSGSAVAVAAGLVSFAIGTDTAGSGRVPAALNGVVGLKPSIGLVSNAGMVPACRSLDCASVFAASVGDAAAVLTVLAGYDGTEPFARRLPVPPARPVPVAAAGLRLAVPRSVADWGSRGEREVWCHTLDTLASAGVALVPVDLEPFFEAGTHLYGGAWLAERLDGLMPFLSRRPDSVLPVLHEVLRGADSISGREAFAAQHRLGKLRRAAERVLLDVDALLTPTVTKTFTIEEMLADPLARNAPLGEFTSFTNLLDLCAVAVPVGLTRAGVPFGVSVQAPAGSDGRVASVAQAVERLVAGGSVGRPLPSAEPSPVLEDALAVAVFGAHLEGQPLHHDLVGRGAVLSRRTTTSADYRLFALPVSAPPPTPAKPGLRWVGEGGTAIEVEVYLLPLAEVGGFLATIPAPLGLGRVTLADGTAVTGFVCEPRAFRGAVDITAYGGWRSYLARSAPG